MIAARVHGPGDLRVESIDPPPVGPGELQLAVTVALTCGTDVKTFKVGHPAAPPYPFTLGHELVGTVTTVGEGAAGFGVGDLVGVANSAPCESCFYCDLGQTTLCEHPLYLFGAFAELVNIPSRIVRLNTFPLPSSIDPAVAALVEPLACAVNAVDGTEIRPDDDVVIVGAGPLGLMLCALIADRGARPIVADPHPERLILAERYGAWRTIEVERSPADGARVREATASGRGAAHVFEAVGRPESWQSAESMARPGGVVTFFGGCAAGTRIAFPAERLHYAQVTLRGVYHHTPRSVRAALETLVAARHPWPLLLGPEIRLEDLPTVLTASQVARPPKYVVRPVQA